MSNNPITMQQIRLILQHLIAGHSQRRIATDLGISRNTVKSYLSRIASCTLGPRELLSSPDHVLAESLYTAADEADRLGDPRREEVLGLMDYFKAELGRTGVTRLLLWEEYARGRGPAAYSYPQFCELLSRGMLLSDASMTFHYRPGELMMVDFAGTPQHYTDPDTGEIVVCPVFVAVLPYSGFGFVVALPDATIPQVVKALNACLEYFGGIPRDLKTDNMRQVVTKSCRYEPAFTEVLDQWALHNDIFLRATRVRKPKDKAPVESSVRLAYQRVYARLRNEVFHSLQGLNAAMRTKLDEHNRKPFQKKDGSRHSVFLGEEKPVLHALPSETYMPKHSVEAKVQRNYHIILGEDRHQYSVPHVHIGKKVRAVYDADTVEIYYQHRRIALHQRNYRRSGYTTLTEHMPENHRSYHRQMGWDEDYFKSQAVLVGPQTAAYIDRVLQSRKFVEQSYHGCVGILRLAKTYGKDRLEAACTRAMQGRVYNYTVLNRILSAGLDRQQPPTQADLFTTPEHGNIRGPEAYR